MNSTVNPMRVRFKEQRIKTADDTIKGTVLKIDYETQSYFVKFDDGYQGWFNIDKFERTFK